MTYEITVENVRSWIIDIFSLPKNVFVNVEQYYSDDNNIETMIVIEIDAKNCYKFTIPDEICNITQNDVKLLKDSLQDFAKDSHPFLSRLLGFFGWWAIFAGSFSLFGVCPVCGNIGCPIGLGVTGIIAGFIAFIKQYMKYYISLIKERFNLLRNI